MFPCPVRGLLLLSLITYQSNLKKKTRNGCVLIGRNVLIKMQTVKHLESLIAPRTQNGRSRRILALPGSLDKCDERQKFETFFPLR